jgi:hypothetical protein
VDQVLAGMRQHTAKPPHDASRVVAEALAAMADALLGRPVASREPPSPRLDALTQLQGENSRFAVAGRRGGLGLGL